MRTVKEKTTVTVPLEYADTGPLVPLLLSLIALVTVFYLLFTAGDCSPPGNGPGLNRSGHEPWRQPATVALRTKLALRHWRLEENDKKGLLIAGLMGYAIGTLCAKKRGCEVRQDIADLICQASEKSNEALQAVKAKGKEIVDCPATG